MRPIPYAIRGALFAPAFIGLVLILKLICLAPIGGGCFADHLAIPIFLPLILVYVTFGNNFVMSHELWFVILYWVVVGLLIGLIFDLRSRRSQYLPAQHPPA